MTSIPRHPFAPYKQLAEGFAERYVGGRKRKPFLGAMAIWRRVFGIDMAETEIWRDIQEDRDGFYHADWIFRDLFYPQVSATLLCEVEPSDGIVRAAEALHAAVDFYLRVRKDTLEPDVIGGYPQDMRRYAYFFSRPTLSSIKHGQIRHTVTVVEPSDYVVVWYRCRAFKLKVLRGDAQVSKADLYASLREIAEFPVSGDESPVGVLSVSMQQRSIALWEMFESANREAVQVLNKGLFAVSLDLDSKAVTLDAVHRSLHVDCFENRDWRQTLHLMVSGSGQVGLLVNPYPGIGGTLSARFTAEIGRACGTGVSRDGSPEGLIEPIAFKDASLPLGDLERLRKAALARFYEPNSCETSLILPGVGSNLLEEKGLKGGAAMNAAFSLAWYRMRGTIPTIGNFINLRSYKFGDIWRYDSSSEALAAFAKSPTLATYRAAEEAHSALVKHHKKANDEFYLGSLILMRLVSERKVSFASFLALMGICTFFVKDFQLRFMNPNIWISGIPAYKGLWATGRPGTTMSYLGKECVGGHFMIYKDHVKLCLVSAPRGRFRGEEEMFAAEVRRALQEITELVQ